MTSPKFSRLLLLPGNRDQRLDYCDVSKRITKETGSTSQVTHKTQFGTKCEKLPLCCAKVIVAGTVSSY